MKCQLLLLSLILHGAKPTLNWNFAGVNIALGKKTTQSPGTYDGLNSSLAVDGNPSTTFSDWSCSHTDGERNTKATWTVDFVETFKLKGIRIYGRDECLGCSGRLKNFMVIGLPSNTTLHDDRVANPQLYSQTIIDIAVDSSNSFSSITVEIPAHLGDPDGGKSYLTLCEVEIYSENNDCKIVRPDGQLRVSIKHDTGYESDSKGLVSSGSVLDLACEGNYRLSGSSSIICMSNRSYNETVPTCTEIQCSRPGDINNVHYLQPNLTTFSVGEKIMWECEPGYTSEGSRERQCTFQTTWSGETPVCTRITCPFPEPFSDGYLEDGTNGRYTNGSLDVWTVIHVVCEEGFKANATSITCNEDGRWSHMPQCGRVFCKRLGKLTGGYYTYSDNGDTETYGYGTTSTAKCNETLYRGSKRTELIRTCGQDGTWTGDEELCVALCEVPTISGGHMQNWEDYYEAGQSLTLTCVEGYALDSEASKETTCQDNHKWVPAVPKCIVKGEDAKPSSAAIAAGAGAGAAVLVLAVVVVVVIVVIRRRAKKKPIQEATDIGETPAAQAYTNELLSTETSFYENSTGANKETDQTDSYYNITDVHRIPGSGIKLLDLANVLMATDSAPRRFDKEFQVFPEGMVKLHQHALKNLRKNRYKELYAYDDTRVVLDIWDAGTDTDYINACYIHGFNKPKVYIASQGPVQDILDDFWRMVWQQNCSKIVMLTNLMEEGKMKCKQYWPESGTETYGSVSVTLTNMETFANFLIRTLDVSRGNEQRQVLQFHFNSWPDKDVPYFCSSLVHFRSKVKNAYTKREGPIVVHCSAGIGRTGTFIAIDFLVDQAETLGYVDVAGCVEALRRQRVNMVQTKKQYIFVHLALVEILVLKTSVVPTAMFEETFQELLAIDDEKKKRKLEIEFEMLWGIQSLTGDSQENKNKDQGNKAKDRYSNILPVKEFMPSISRPGKYMYGEYINAAFLPMYRERNALIIAQTPLETTIRDFWNLIVHQKVHTIVMMDHATELSSGEKYWPEMNERKTFEDKIHITNKKALKQRGHIVITLEVTAGTEERDVRLIQFEKWPKGQTLPETPDQILSALDLVEAHQRHTGNKPVIVHCMDGVKRSGLFCVIASLLDRTKVEQDVAISQVIEEIRSRRPKVIPTVEQFQFCHEVVLAFLKRYNTYSNFEFNA